jgi:signal transduction histidine kinase
MRRPWQTWLIFGVFVLILVSAMGWISATMLRMEREQIQAENRAVLEENVRLALWRMDSFLSPIIAQEQVRPYYAYQAYYPVQRAYDNMFNPRQEGEVLKASEVMIETWPYVVLHFQFSPEGELTSPKVPGEHERVRAIHDGYLAEDIIAEVEAKLALLRDLAPQQFLIANCPTIPQSMSMNDVLGNGANFNVDRQQPYLTNRYTGQQRTKSQVEWNSRMNVIDNNAILQQDVINIDRTGFFDACEGYMKPMWYRDTLLLARRVSVRGQSYIQGCWLDWPAMETQMRQDVRDLLPEARLVAYEGTKVDEEGRLLANLPVRLEPGPLDVVVEEELSPIRTSLLVAWGCVALTILAVAGLLHGTMVLSERRGAFVSAVTHEMRTPLTTFRMYTEMLLRGMVPDEEKRRKYVHTMSVEANRLAHMVENVLAYARLEGNGKAGRIEPVGLAEIMERVEQRLTERAEQAKFDFDVEVAPPVREAMVLADPAAVEHILFNLVDNACKYATGADPRRIRLSIRPNGRSVHLAVRDYGPGIPTSETRELFKPFHKSAHQAAESSPGVGLGLALSRRLARRMQGDLTIDASAESGACFVLSLPMAEGANRNNERAT